MNLEFGILVLVTSLLFLCVNILKLAELKLRLFSLVKMRPISISLLKLNGLIGIF